MDLYFSTHFDVDPALLKEYGALDISVASDLPLFVDPFLLFNKDLGIEGEEAIVLIDARSDNKPSASKA